MSVLTAKDIQAFANMINTSNPESNNSYSISGTVISINDPIELQTDDESVDIYEYTAQVALDGGSSDYPCTAKYQGIVCAEGDRVVVTMDNGTATITENYTNPNGNDIIIKEVFADEDGDIPISTGQPSGDIDGQLPVNMKYVYLTKTINDLPDDYEIIGLKSVGIQIKSPNWSINNWVDISTDLASTSSSKRFASHAHLSGWNFDDKTISITINFTNTINPASSTGDYLPFDDNISVRARVLVSCMLKTKLRYIPVGED